MSEIKVTAEHLKRDAYLYVRQSTLRQVAENGESTQRQYALRHRAIAAGWPPERVRVIDCDLGKSGATASMRNGFQELVSEVVLGKAGIVMGLEVSRLARNSADWHRLIELCALTATLILDEDGIYDPAGFNDRLLLGLKGAMSEAELHILKARMRGGQLNKARRGELEMGPPVGLMYRADGVLDLDPDAPKCKRPSGWYSRPSSAPAARSRPSVSSGTKASCSRVGCAQDRTRANFSGLFRSTRACCRCCTTPATPAPSSMVGSARDAARTAVPVCRYCRDPTGSS
jgi:DNA invertase Pin-like site-specific DNA recombinase